MPATVPPVVFVSSEVDTEGVMSGGKCKEVVVGAQVGLSEFGGENVDTTYTAAANADDDGGSLNEGSPVVLSDSEMVEVRPDHIPSASEHALARRLMSAPVKDITDFLPSVNKKDYECFKKTIVADLKVKHITKCNFPIDHEFLFVLGEKQKWTSTLHMEVLMSYLGDRHKEILAADRACFASPFLTSHLQGKFRAFNAAKDRGKFRWPK